MRKPLEYARLDAFPELVDGANQLIERSFGYHSPHHFVEDFAVIADPTEAHHRHVLIDPQGPKVAAHVGARLRSFCFGAETIPVVLLGGIAVDEGLRGQGFFQDLFTKVLAHYHTQCAFFLLWSDKHELYSKWNFFLSGQQWCYRALEKKSEIRSTKLKDLSPEVVQAMSNLYKQQVNQNYFSPLRDERDWRDFSRVTSSELYLLGSPLKGYAFLNKGMDLGGIIHDWAHQDGLTGLIQDIGDKGVIWAARNEEVPDNVLQELQQVGLWRPNTHPMALKKIASLLDLPVEWKDPHFVIKKNGINVSLTADELLDELFGYGKHMLRTQKLPMYIGGLDCI